MRFPSKNTGVDWHSLFQGTFLTQGLNLFLLNCRQILYCWATRKVPCKIAAAAKSLQSCPTLCDPIDCSPPGSPIPGILLARTLEWVDISFSNAWKWKVKVKLLSPVQILVTPRTAAYQAPLSMGFSRQEYWSGVPLPSPHVRLSAFIYQNIFYRDTKLLEPLSIIIHLSFFHFLKWMHSSFGYSSLILQLSVNPSRCQELC